jgi:hypothetical protein
MKRLVERSIAGELPYTPVLSVIFAEFMDSLGTDQANDSQNEAVVDKALEWFRASPLVVVAVYNLQMRRGRKQQALEALLLLEQMAVTGEYDRGMPVNPEVFGKPFWKQLDRLADQLGRWEICKRCDPYL